MAKKEKVVSDSKSMGFDELNSFLTKEVNPDGSMINDNLNIGVKEWLSTGIYALDLLISGRLLDGGIPNNRLTGIGGASGTGKTFMALNIVREAQKRGYFVIYIDTENAIDKELIVKFGVDTNMFRIDPMSTVEQFKIYMAKFIDKLDTARKAGKTLPKVLIVLDSLGDLASEKEVNDAVAGEMKHDMTRSKQLKAVFRIVTSKLGILNVPMVLTNHTYLTQDMFPKEVFSGGTGGIYNCSTICMLSKAKLKVGDEDDLYTIGQSGIIMTVKTEKNRFAIPGKIKIELDFNDGANPYKYLENWCTPENFNTIGIAKGKLEVDKETGEEYFKPGGNFWYVRHLGKSVPGKALHTERVFTLDVLKAMAPIAEKTFKYASAADIQDMDDKLDEFEENVANSDFGMTQSAEDLNGDTLFGNIED